MIGSSNASTISKTKIEELEENKLDKNLGLTYAGAILKVGANGEIKPEYIDAENDVLEGYLDNNTFYEDSAHTITLSGLKGKIYVDIPSNSLYRYDGTNYVLLVIDDVNSSETTTYSSEKIDEKLATINEDIETINENLETINEDLGTINETLETKSNKGTIKTYTLEATTWANNQYTLNVDGKTTDWNARVVNWQDGTAQDVLANSNAIAEANIYQIIDNGTSLTFVCETTPTTDLKVDIELFEAKDINIDPVFANNDWATIKAVAKSGNIPSTWAVGDTKQVTVGGNTYDIRIADKQTGRYKYVSDNSDTHITFEAVQVIPTTTMWNPTSSYTYGGFENCQLRAFLNGGNYWTSQDGSTTTNIPLESSFYYALSQGDTSAQQLYSALEDIKFPCLTGGGVATVTRTATCKLFTASLAEMGYNNGQSTPYINESYLVQSGSYTWDYYLTHTSSNDKIKYEVGTTLARSYWSRSARSGEYSRAFYVVSNGNGTSNNAYDNYHVSFCFAF